MLYDRVMDNPYYSTWKQSEAARDQIILILTATLVAQTALYPALARLYQSPLLRYARAIYIAGNILADLAIGLALGASIR
jgi:hypothetical protein